VVSSHVPSQIVYIDDGLGNAANALVQGPITGQAGMDTQKVVTSAEGIDGHPPPTWEKNSQTRAQYPSAAPWPQPNGQKGEYKIRPYGTNEICRGEPCVRPQTFTSSCQLFRRNCISPGLGNP